MLRNTISANITVTMQVIWWPIAAIKLFEMVKAKVKYLNKTKSDIIRRKTTMFLILQDMFRIHHPSSVAKSKIKLKIKCNSNQT